MTAIQFMGLMATAIQRMLIAPSGGSKQVFSFGQSHSGQPCQRGHWRIIQAYRNNSVPINMGQMSRTAFHWDAMSKTLILSQAQAIWINTTGVLRSRRNIRAEHTRITRRSMTTVRLPSHISWGCNITVLSQATTTRRLRAMQRPISAKAPIHKLSRVCRN